MFSLSEPPEGPVKCPVGLASAPFSLALSLQLWQREELLRQKPEPRHFLQTIPLDIPETRSGLRLPRSHPCLCKQLLLFVSTLLWAASSRESQPVPQGCCPLCREVFPLFSVVLSQSCSISCRCLLALVLQDLVHSSTPGSSSTIQAVLLGRQIPPKGIHRRAAEHASGRSSYDPRPSRTQDYLCRMSQHRKYTHLSLPVHAIVHWELCAQSTDTWPRDQLLKVSVVEEDLLNTKISGSNSSAQHVVLYILALTKLKCSTGTAALGQA